MNKHYKNFFGLIPSHRRSKQNLLDEVRFRLVLLSPLPGILEEEYNENIHNMTRLMCAARKTKKKYLSRCIKHLDQYILETVTNAEHGRKNKDAALWLTYRCIGSDDVSNRFINPKHGVKIGTIAATWNHVMDFADDTTNTPYNDLYWHRVVECYLYNRTEREDNEDPTTVIQRAGEESYHEALEFFQKYPTVPNKKIRNNYGKQQTYCN